MSPNECVKMKILMKIITARRIIFIFRDGVNDTTDSAKIDFQGWNLMTRPFNKTNLCNAISEKCEQDDNLKFDARNVHFVVKFRFDLIYFDMYSTFD